MGPRPRSTHPTTDRREARSRLLRGGDDPSRHERRAGCTWLHRHRGRHERGTRHHVARHRRGDAGSAHDPREHRKLPRPSGNSWVNLWFDVDSDPRTGDGGDEALVRYEADGSLELFAWNGSRLVQGSTAGVTRQLLGRSSDALGAASVDQRARRIRNPRGELARPGSGNRRADRVRLRAERRPLVVHRACDDVPRSRERPRRCTGHHDRAGE